MVNREREPLEGRHPAGAETPPQTSTELTDTRVDMPLTLTDGFQVIDPRGRATVEVAGGLAQVDAASVTVGDDVDLLNGQGLNADYVPGLITDYDGDLSGQNRLTNPGFETDASDWVVSGVGTVARTNSYSKYGMWSGAVTKTVGAGDIAARTGSYTVVPGRVYTFSTWVRTAVTARTCYVTLSWYDANFGLISNSNGPSSADTTTFQRRFVSATAPATAAYVYCFVTWLTAALNEVHAWDAAALWDQTAFTNLGWSFTNCTPYLLSSGATTNELYIVSTSATAGIFCGVTTPRVMYNALRAYEAYMPSVVQVLSVNPGEGAVAETVFINNLNVEYPDGNRFRLAFGGGGRWGTYNSGGVGTPTAAYADINGLGYMGVPPNIVRVRANLGVWSTGTGDTFTIKGFSLAAGGQVTGHINPVGSINRLKSSISNFGAAYGGAGSAWATLNTVTVDNSLFVGFSRSQTSLLLNWVCYFVLGTVANSIVSTRVAVSFDNGISYQPTTQGNNGTTHASGASVPLSGTALYVGEITSNVLVRVEGYQQTGGAAGTFAAGLLTALFLPN